MRMLLALSVFILGNLAFAQNAGPDPVAENAKDFYTDQEVQTMSNSLSYLPAGSRFEVSDDHLITEMPGGRCAKVSQERYLLCEFCLDVGRDAKISEPTVFKGGIVTDWKGRTPVVGTVPMKSNKGSKIYLYCPDAQSISELYSLLKKNNIKLKVKRTKEAQLQKGAPSQAPSNEESQGVSEFNSKKQSRTPASQGK